MRFPPLFAVLSVTTLAIACSSDSPSQSTGSTTPGDSGAGDGGSASGGKGGSSSGGKGGVASGSGGAGAGGKQQETGGADPADCEIDSGTDACRLCLASHCCDDFKGCTADAACEASFEKYQTCVHGAKGDANVISQCFSTFAQEIGATHAAFNACDYNCSADCGGIEQL